MEIISKDIQVGVNADKAFTLFIKELNNWWPKEYTWSQDKLKKIYIDVEENGLCSEIGPYGFRCDWGRITELEEPKKVSFKWQISPNREPVPNPEEASDITIGFIEGDGYTTIKLEHKNFENHGDGAEEYMKMMNGKKGWDYILDCYKKYCEKK